MCGDRLRSSRLIKETLFVKSSCSSRIRIILFVSDNRTSLPRNLKIRSSQLQSPSFQLHFFAEAGECRRPRIIKPVDGPLTRGHLDGAIQTLAVKSTAATEVSEEVKKTNELGEDQDFSVLGLEAGKELIEEYELARASDLRGSTS